MRRLALPLVVLIVALGATGCDWSKPGGKVAEPRPETVVGTLPKQRKVEVPQQFAKGDPTSGKPIFLANCTGCHTLRAANSHGNVGPNLDQAQPDLSLIVQRVRKGMGAMPPFEGRLKVDQIRDVAAFVYSSTHPQGGGTG